MKARSKILRQVVLTMMLAYTSIASAQLSIVSNANALHNYATLSNFAIVNTGSMVDVSIRIDLMEQHEGDVLSVIVASVNLLPGSNPFSSLSASARFEFYNSAASDYLRNNDQLSDGKYRVCYQVISNKTGSTDAKLCREFGMRSSSPLVLTSPADESIICDERPIFQWVNPSPLPAGSKVRLMLAEIKEGQSGTEAIYRNVPLLNIMDVGLNATLPLPTFIESLKENVHYAWQVIIYNNAGIVQKSEIWTFRKNCSNEQAVRKEAAFPQLTKGGEVSIYLVKDVIRFSFVNSYSTEKLDYSIIDAETNKAIRHFPEVTIHTGVNLISVDVDDCSGLKKGKYYMIRVNNVQSMPLQMKFRYEE